MKGIKTLLILTSFLLISCGADEETIAQNKADEDARFLEFYGDAREDFSCRSYKVWNMLELEDVNDTSHNVLYSRNLGRRSIWIDNRLIDDEPYLTDDGKYFSSEYTSDEALHYTFDDYTYQLEIEMWNFDNEEMYKIRFHCFPQQ